ncbi:MAG TPA: vitamin K epoxide reductase family protein [Acidimicrobiales bacterium]|jgi:uncharacterized membrane protein
MNDIGSSTKGVVVAGAEDGPVEDDVEPDDVEYDEDVDLSPPGVSRRIRITALVLALLGLADSTYLTIAHFETNLLSATCPANTVDNCQAVTTGPWSHPFGIPVAILGLAFYTAFVTINLPYFWKTKDVRIHWLRAAMSVSGIGFVLYLVYIELFLAKLICLYCTGVHVVTFALFILIATTLPKMVQPQQAVWADGDDFEDEPEE